MGIMPQLSDELIDNDCIPRREKSRKSNSEPNESNELDSNEPNNNNELNNINEPNSNLFNQFRKFFHRLSLKNSSKKMIEEKVITDEEFQAVVQELREKNKITSFGIQEILLQKKIKEHVENNKMYLKNKSKNNGKEQHQHDNCPFQGKVNFLEKASKEVAEASKNPIYKRDSFNQKHNLQRVPKFYLKSEKKWNNIAALLLDEECDSEDEKNDKEGKLLMKLCYTPKLMNKNEMNTEDCFACDHIKSCMFPPCA